MLPDDMSERADQEQSHSNTHSPLQIRSRSGSRRRAPSPDRSIQHPYETDFDRQAPASPIPVVEPHSSNRSFSGLSRQNSQQSIEGGVLKITNPSLKHTHARSASSGSGSHAKSVPSLSNTLSDLDLGTGTGSQVSPQSGSGVTIESMAAEFSKQSEIPRSRSYGSIAGTLGSPLPAMHDSDSCEPEQARGRMSTGLGGRNTMSSDPKRRTIWRTTRAVSASDATPRFTLDKFARSFKNTRSTPNNPYSSSSEIMLVSPVHDSIRLSSVATQPESHEMPVSHLWTPGRQGSFTRLKEWKDQTTFNPPSSRGSCTSLSMKDDENAESGSGVFTSERDDEKLPLNREGIQQLEARQRDKSARRPNRKVSFSLGGEDLQGSQELSPAAESVGIDDPAIYSPNEGLVYSPSHGSASASFLASSPVETRRARHSMNYHHDPGRSNMRRPSLGGTSVQSFVIEEESEEEEDSRRRSRRDRDEGQTKPRSDHRQRRRRGQEDQSSDERSWHDQTSSGSSLVMSRTSSTGPRSKYASRRSANATRESLLSPRHSGLHARRRREIAGSEPLEADLSAEQYLESTSYAPHTLSADEQHMADSPESWTIEAATDVTRHEETGEIIVSVDAGSVIALSEEERIRFAEEEHARFEEERRRAVESSIQVGQPF